MRSVAVKQGCGWQGKEGSGFRRNDTSVGSESAKVTQIAVHHSTNKPDADQWPSQLTFGKLTLFEGLILRK